MKAWRKLHSSILESERFMDVSTEAKVLFFLLVVAQDDTGYYPWERMKVRSLVAVCGWTEQQAGAHAQVLVDGGMATWCAGGITLRKGADLNGTARGDRKPFLYQRSATDVPLAVTVIPSAGVSIAQIGHEASDIPVAVTDCQVAVLETETETETEKSKKQKPIWLSPDWFAPLTKLSGYREKNHERAAKGIEAACKESGVSVADVIKGFADDWPFLKTQYRWDDPVATLKGTPLGIAIKKIKGGTYRNGSGRGQVPSDPREYAEVKDAKTW